MNPLLDALTEAGRQAGLTARHAISGVGGMASAFANPLALALNEGLELAGSDYRFPDQYAALQRAMTEAGLPEPQGALERGIGFASEIGVPDPTDSAKVVSSLSHMIDPQWAMTVFHGSPHKWDKVDLTKVGTGEGAQAYGHGFYAAENPAVAGSYRFVNARIDPDTATYDGKSMESLYNAAQRKQERAHRLKDNAAIQKANAELKFWEDMMVRNHPDQVIQDVLSNADDWPELTNFVKSLDRKKFGGIEEAGHLYELDLPDETIERMLDWDKPLSEQPESVQKALGKLRAGDDPILSELFADGAPAEQLGALSSSKGGQIYNTLAEQYGGPAGLSRRLNELGIPGIKYLDGTSRSAGEGTRNFVVFDEQYIKPLTRNGEAIGQAAEAPASRVEAAANGFVGDGLDGRTLDDVRKTWGGSGVEIDAYTSKARPEVVTLSRLVVPKSERGQGIGSAAMKDLISYADDTGKTVALSPSTDFGASSVKRLKDFYKRFGFVENKGRNKDFTLSESMYRLPTNPKKGPKIEKMHVGVNHGQNDYRAVAKNDAGEIIGDISYSEYEGVPSINMVRVRPEYQGQGIGSQLVESLTRQMNEYDDYWPYDKIEWGMTTEDGTKLKAALDKKFR